MFLVAGIFSSCSKDSEDISLVTNLPQFEITGGPLYVTLEQPAGTAFVDPGAKAYTGTTEVPVTTTGTVDLSTPDLYQLYYSAYDETKQFQFSTDRKVLVTDEPLTIDYAGNYKVVSATRTNIMTVTKMVTDVLGWYRASDTWFQASRIPVEFVDLGSSLKIIPGNSNFGPFDGTVTYDATTSTLTFRLHFTSGGNAGVAWTTSWQKQ